MFSMYLTEYTSQSKVQFGGYDQKIVDKSIRDNKEETNKSDNPDGIYWMEINSQNHWEVVLFDARVNDSPVPISTSKIIFDSGSSLIYLPQ